MLVSGNVFVVYKVPLDPDFMIMAYEIIPYLTAADLGECFWIFFQAFLETNLRRLHVADRWEDMRLPLGCRAIK